MKANTEHAQDFEGVSGLAVDETPLLFQIPSILSTSMVEREKFPACHLKTSQLNLASVRSPYSISITEPSIRSVLLPSSVRPPVRPKKPSSSSSSALRRRFFYAQRTDFTSRPRETPARSRCRRAAARTHPQFMKPWAGGDSRNQRRCSETRSLVVVVKCLPFPSPSLLVLPFPS